MQDNPFDFGDSDCQMVVDCPTERAPRSMKTTNQKPKPASLSYPLPTITPS